MIRNTSLDGEFKLRKFDAQESLEAVLADEFIPEGWLDAPVPGDVRQALWRRGLITGFYMGKNLDAERWIDQSDWVYFRRFRMGERLGKAELVFEGVDTLASVYLNGRQIGSCANMFIPHRFEITDLLRYEETNTLVIRFPSPDQELKDADLTGLYPANDTQRLLLRKSQMNYGWDFCGHCVSRGLWKSVRIEQRNAPKIENAFLETLSLDENSAVLRYRGWVSEQRADLCLRVEIGGQTVQTPIASEAEGTIELKNPRLWWPRPYGSQELYDAHFTLFSGEEVLDERRFRFGVRTISLSQDKLPVGGREFVFVVNGRRLFIRGANWVPLHAIYANIEEKNYATYIERAKDANLSMLRVWGGGIYEPELFFDLCDQAGILVMQDCMFACGIYPQTDSYVDEARKEATYVSALYFNHACLAMWSADNENDQAYGWYGRAQDFPSNRVSRVGVAEGVCACDTGRPFLFSSPSSPFPDEPGGDDPNSDQQGDVHEYMTRYFRGHERYYKNIRHIVPRFLSEFGFCSLPCRDSVDKFNFFGEKLNLDADPYLNEVQAFTQLGIEGNEDRLIYFTQLGHAQGLKYWIEYLRSYRGICGGCLYWKFNDPLAPNRENMLFPTMMSSLDFYGQTKLAYYYTRRAYADVALVFREEESGALSVYGCNETLVDRVGGLCLAYRTFAGETLWKVETDAHLLHDAVQLLYRWEKPIWMDDRTPQGTLTAQFIGDGDVVQNRFFPLDIAGWIGFVPPMAVLSVSGLSRMGDEWSLRVEADRFAQDVTLWIQDADAWYSDNCFCLDKDESALIRFRLPASACRDRLLRVRALNARDIVFDLNPFL